MNRGRVDIHNFQILKTFITVPVKGPNVSLQTLGIFQHQVVKLLCVSSTHTCSQTVF